MPTKIELFNAPDVSSPTITARTEGFVESDVVECTFHGGQFNIKTGAVVGPPCMVPIKTYPTVVEDGKVFIEV